VKGRRILFSHYDFPVRHNQLFWIEILSKHLKKLKNLIGPVILIYFLIKIDFGALKEVLTGIDPIFFAALMIFFPMMMIKTYRWLVLLKNFGVNIDFSNLFNLNLKGVLYGSITPGRLGEISKGYMLGKMKYSLSSSIVSAVLDRIVDIFFLLGFGLFGFFYFYKEFQIDVVLLVIVVGGIAAVSALLLNRRVRLKITTFIRKKIKDDDGDVIQSLKEIKKDKMLVLSALSILAWVLYFCEIFLFSESLSIDVDVIFLVSAISASTIISILPISILGMGTRDATLIFLFSMKGIATEKTLALSFLILLMFGFNICACYLYSLVYDLKNYKNYNVISKGEC